MLWLVYDLNVITTKYETFVTNELLRHESFHDSFMFFKIVMDDT